ncbi:MAG: hypothetical protein NC203_05595 [Firmicutes bacterium]|nr:hypothetical protein [[Eubacterium] siraeum]MCM1487825.1 hypothetical protein [Bacillota bacterium]
METWLLTVKSYTEAMKGKSFLQSLNINSSVEKTGGRGGCTYAIRIKGSPERASRLLGTVGVNVIRASKGRG